MGRLRSHVSRLRCSQSSLGPCAGGPLRMSALGFAVFESNPFYIWLAKDPPGFCAAFLSQFARVVRTLRAEILTLFLPNEKIHKPLCVLLRVCDPASLCSPRFWANTPPHPVGMLAFAGCLPKRGSAGRLVRTGVIHPGHNSGAYRRAYHRVGRDGRCPCRPRRSDNRAPPGGAPTDRCLPRGHRPHAAPRSSSWFVRRRERERGYPSGRGNRLHLEWGHASFPLTRRAVALYWATNGGGRARARGLPVAGGSGAGVAAEIHTRRAQPQRPPGRLPSDSHPPIQRRSCLPMP